MPSGGVFLRGRRPDDAACESGRRADVVAAGLLAPVLVAWETLLRLVVEDGLTPAGWWPGALSGLATVVPLAVVAAYASLRLARRIGLTGEGGALHPAAAAMAALVLVVVTVPALEARSRLVERLPAPPAQPADGVFKSTSDALCSLGGALPEAVAQDWRERVNAHVRGSLVLHALSLPMLAILLSLLARRRHQRPQSVRRRLAMLVPLELLAAGCVVAGMPDDRGGQDAVARVDEGPRSAPPRGSRTGSRGLDGSSSASAAFTTCPTGGDIREYDVSAIPVTLTLNRFGDHAPASFMYALDSQIPAIRTQESAPLPDRVSTGLRGDPIQPLVLRANLGDCLVLRFTNRLRDVPATLSIQGLAHRVIEANDRVGQNADGFAQPGQTVTYSFVLPSDPIFERAYYFQSHGASRQLTSHGLFGALVIEPRGSRWLDPDTAQPLSRTSWDAIIEVPGGTTFREFVMMYHEIGDEDFTEIFDANGNKLPVIDDLSTSYRPGGRALNYRSEPFRNRLQLGSDESQAYGSYAFGDPATPIPRSYLGEPTKTRLMHTGSEVFHVHHLHGGATRWRENPLTDPSDLSGGLRKEPTQTATSNRVDSLSIGPGSAFNLEHECGAGGCQQAAADFLFHCHIQHHYLSGMWSFWRVFDTLQPHLAVLPGRTPPPQAVDSTGLVGRVVEGKKLVPRALVSGAGEVPLEDFIEAQLPPPGQRLHDEDATVWDWVKTGPDTAPVYLGEPDDTRVWANYRSETPGERPRILFNPTNGRYAWPLFRPHLARRPPFAPARSGAPWLGETATASRPDGLCPDQSVLPDNGRKTRIYPISAIATSIPISSRRTLDERDGRLFVLNEDRDDVLAGRKPKQPLVLRSNVSDCVDIVFTNEIPDEIAFQQHSKANLHTHFVQFDPQASDGVISGFAYEQSVRPYKLEQRTLTQDAEAGDLHIEVTNVRELRVGIWIGVGLGEGMCAPPGGGSPVACTEVRRIDAIDGTTITLNRPLSLGHEAGEHVGVEFVRYAWYSDVDSGTVFWHDHITPGGWGRGFFGAHIIEPKGSTYHDPRTGEEVRSGPIVDVRTPPDATVGFGQKGSFREVFLALTNENKETDGAINMRSEPLERRDGQGWANAFSSVVHGDPWTPLPRAYVGDPLVIRGLGVTEFVAGLRIVGHRFRNERYAQPSGLVDTAILGVSERFDLVLEDGAGGNAQRPGDYLYFNTIGREMIGGAWGILRVHDTLQDDLMPLPDRAPPPTGPGFPQQSHTGTRPVRSVDPGHPCPPGAPVRSYDVAITRARIVYSADEEDSGGVAYVLNEGGGLQPMPSTSCSATRPGAGHCNEGPGAGAGGGGVNIDRGRITVTEPLVIRVNADECLEVRLTNLTDDPASFTPSRMCVDVQGSFGSPVGFNPDSTTLPGETRLYRFDPDQLLGTMLVQNLADPFSIPRGAYAAVVVEPPGSVYLNPVSGQPVRSGVVADIVSPTRTFRELVALLTDEDPRIGQNTMPYPDKAKGIAAMSYSAEAFKRRGVDADDPDEVGVEETAVYDSRVHGDPRLVLRAHPGDDVVLRVVQAWGEQAHVFATEGRPFRSHALRDFGEVINAIHLVPHYTHEAELLDGNGETVARDTLFLDRRAPFTEAGLWGIIRTEAPERSFIRPLPERPAPAP